MRHFLLIVLLAFIYFSSIAQEDSSSKKEFQFNELTFHSSACNGTCPEISLNIRNDRKIQLIRTIYKAKGLAETLLSGAFKGSVKDEDFVQLIDLLKKANLDSLNFPNVLCCDSSVKTLIVSYNQNYKRFKSMKPPKEAERLITFLIHLASTVTLSKYNGAIDFEQ